MGCFSVCFRVRDRKRRNVHVDAASVSPSRCTERAAAKNRPLASRLQQPAAENQAPNSQFFEDQRKPENLHRRIGVTPRWAQKHVAPAEIPNVQRPHDYSDNVENAHKEPIFSVKKDPLEEVNELASELADLAITIGEEEKDVKMFGNEVKSLRSCGTLTPISGNQMITVSEQSLQTVGCGVNRVVSSKKTISMYSEKSIVSDSQYSIQGATKPTVTEVKVSDKEDVLSKPWKNVADSNQLCPSTNREDQNGVRTKAVGKTVTFDLAMESPSASFDSANTRHSESSYDSISDASVTLNSDTEEEEEEEEEEDDEMPVMINARELMEGLEDDDHNRNFSFDLEVPENARKPLWMHFADDSPDSLFDSETVSGFRKAFDELSPCSPVSISGTLKSINEPETPVSACSSRFRCNSFPRPINKSPLILPEASRIPDFENQGFGILRAPPGGEYKVVLYFTSLRAIRKTYEDCCYVRLILQGFRIFVDERDVSLHAEYRQELQRLLGTERISVPMLFIRGECIGGADRVIQLHEEGELEKYLEGFPVMSCIRVCDGCGDLRFVPCPSCHGSCKLYTDEDELIRCPDCNENGLIRCSICY